MCEAEIDCYAARLLFLVSIAIDTSERLDDRRLTVINMAGCTHNEMGGLRGQRLWRGALLLIAVAHGLVPA